MLLKNASRCILLISTSSLTLSIEAGENRLISSFNSFCSFRNFFISSTSLHTGSGTVSFLQAFGPVLLALSDFIPPNVTASSLGAGAAAGAAAGVPNKLGAGAAKLAGELVLPNKLGAVPPRVKVDPVEAAGAAASELLPNNEVVLVVVAGLAADKFPNKPGRLRKFKQDNKGT